MQYRNIALASFAFAMLACSDSSIAPDSASTNRGKGKGGGGPISAAVATITVSPPSSSILVGQTAQLTATDLDAKGNVLSGRTNVWASTNTAVASVSSSGVVTAVAAGTVTITATDSTVTGSATVTVSAPQAPAPTVAVVTVTPSSSSVAVGVTEQLKATDYDPAGNALSGQTNTWKSSNAAVATVSSSGVVTGTAAGTVTISATDGTVSGSAAVTISAPPPPAPTVASVSVSPASSSISVGATVQLSATDKDASGNALSGQTNVWSSSNTAVATISSSGLVTAVAAGAATITATDGSVSGSATVNVSAPIASPSSSDYAHQPAGFTLFTERPFNSKATSSSDAAGAEGWNAGEEIQWPNFTIVQDGTAPKSPSNVGQMKYPAGFQGGNEPGYADKNFPSGYTKVYMSIWVKLSSNFYGNPTEVNKMLFMWMGGHPKFVLSADGVGTGTLAPTIRVQDAPDATPVRPPNVVANAQVVRGEWHHWEVLVTANTPGVANGQVQWWIDGTLVSDWRDINLAYSSDSPDWQIYQWAPTWGGIGGTVPADMYLWWDHVYVSMAP